MISLRKKCSCWNLRINCPAERACLCGCMAWNMARRVGRCQLPMTWDPKPCHSSTIFSSHAFFSKLQINKCYLLNSLLFRNSLTKYPTQKLRIQTTGTSDQHSSRWGERARAKRKVSKYKLLFHDGWGHYSPQ